MSDYSPNAHSKRAVPASRDRRFGGRVAAASMIQSVIAERTACRNGRLYEILVGMTSLDTQSNRRSDGPRLARYPILVLVALVTVALVVVWIVRANQVTIDIEHPAMTADRSVTIEAGDPSPLVVTVHPARRADGASVELNGLAVAHPSGDEPGQLMVDLSLLAPGAQELVIRVPRPTWTEAVTTVTIDVAG